MYFESLSKAKKSLMYEKIKVQKVQKYDIFFATSCYIFFQSKNILIKYIQYMWKIL